MLPTMIGMVSAILVLNDILQIVGDKAQLFQRHISEHFDPGRAGLLALMFHQLLGRGKKEFFIGHQARFKRR